MSLRTLLAVVVLTAIGGCASSVDGPIDYNVTGGFAGTGDGTPSLHIELDGTMTRTPPGGEPEITVLDPATLRDVRAKIDAAHFPSLSDYYFCCPDDYVSTVSVELDGTVHSVMADSLAEMPPALEAAIDALHDLATGN